MNTTRDEAFTEEVVSRLAGVSVRQLASWDQRGFFSPEFADFDLPYSRLYSFRDVVSLKVLNTLRKDAAIPLGRLGPVKQALYALDEASWADTILYIHNKRVTFVNPRNDAFGVVAAGQALLQISLLGAARTVRDAMRRILLRTGCGGKLEKRLHSLHSRLVIAGTRVRVEDIRGMAAKGYSFARIKLEYPDLTDGDVQAALEHRRPALHGSRDLQSLKHQ
jgi:uncharacterized protein (DUF433 family)